MDDAISTFCAFTDASPDKAQRYLALTDGNMEQAVELYFNSPDLDTTAPAPAPPPRNSNREAPIEIEDDDDEPMEDDDLRETGARQAALEDDEAMARRLQEEMYGGRSGNAVDDEGVRAPMARTTETLIGPDSSDWRDDPGQMNAAIAEQLMQRTQRRHRGAGPGIFNQRETPSIWNADDAADPAARQHALARATGGASAQSAKSNHLAELFRPPFDLISPLPFSDARDEGKETEKWLLVNTQDPSIFDCQVLNRDIWKNASIRDTVKEHFIFLQYNKDDPRADSYLTLYLNAVRHSDDTYPHIGIIDPRTGELVKTWSGAPSPKAADFLMDLHEFLDRYSLSMERTNPVQTKRKESRKDVAHMSEEEMLEMALQNSLANGSSTRKEEDPDALTRLSPENTPRDKGKAPVRDEPVASDGLTDSTNGAPAQDTPFSQISSTAPHEEPAAGDPDSTRIQFRYSGGRIVRRFLLSQPVRRIYEWLKAAPLEGQTGNFELILMGKNLIEALDLSIAEAGLKNASVMVEFVED